jgi:hypothetical protein
LTVIAGLDPAIHRNESGGQVPAVFASPAVAMIDE